MNSKARDECLSTNKELEETTNEQAEKGKLLAGAERDLNTKKKEKEQTEAELKKKKEEMDDLNNRIEKLNQIFNDINKAQDAAVKEAEEKDYVIFMGLRRLGLVKEANEIGKCIGYQIDDYNPLIVTTNCGLINAVSQEESIKLIKEAGFDAYD